MSYRNELKKRIEELNQEISEDKGQIEALKKELKRLELAEFEEDLSEDSSQQLLKG
jgi:peptidoglycan hydrolase CwlO-like protein